jgi:hypothetical protein
MTNGRVSWWAALNVIAAVAVAGVIFWAVMAQQRVKKLEDRLAGIEKTMRADASKKAPVIPTTTPTKRKKRPATLASTRPAATKPIAKKSN